MTFRLSSIGSSSPAGQLIRLRLQFLFGDRIILLVYLFATSFFICQHYFNLGWDFAAYALNARYLFWGGEYVEVGRAPLLSIILGVLSPLGYASELITVVVTSTLYLASTLMLAERVHRQIEIPGSLTLFRRLAYIFVLNPIVLNYGVIEGTDVLSLSLFVLFFCRWQEGVLSGHLLAAAFLTRYNYMLFLPLLLIQKNHRAIVLNGFLFALLVFPWLLYCMVDFGHPLQSIVNISGVAMVLQEYLRQPIQFMHLAQGLSFHLPFFFFGLPVFVSRLIRTERTEERKFLLWLCAVAAVFLYFYTSTPQKVPRYAVNLSFVGAFLSAIGFSCCVSHPALRRYAAQLCVFFCIADFGYSFSQVITPLRSHAHGTQHYHAAFENLRRYGVAECSVVSAHWTPMAYFIGSVSPVIESFRRIVAEQRIVLVFQSMPTPEDIIAPKELSSARILFQTRDHTAYVSPTFTVENCSKRRRFKLEFIPDVCKFLAQRFKNKSLSRAVHWSCSKFNWP